MSFQLTKKERDFLKALKPHDVKWARDINLMNPMQVHLLYIQHSPNTKESL